MEITWWRPISLLGLRGQKEHGLYPFGWQKQRAYQYWAKLYCKAEITYTELTYMISNIPFGVLSLRFVISNPNICYSSIHWKEINVVKTCIIIIYYSISHSIQLSLVKLVSLFGGLGSIGGFFVSLLGFCNLILLFNVQYFQQRGVEYMLK